MTYAQYESYIEELTAEYEARGPVEARVMQEVQEAEYRAAMYDILARRIRDEAL